MADEFGESGTEAATPRRREEARQQGRVAFSAELSGGLLLLAGVGGLWLGAGPVARGLLNNLRLDLRGIYRADLGPAQVQAIFTEMVGRGLEMIGYFMALVFVVALAAGALQVGLHITTDVFGLRWEKLSPAAGWSRVLSWAGAMRGVTAVVKMALVAGIAFWILRGRGTEIVLLGQGALASGVAQGWDMVIRLALAVAAVLVLGGVADYLVQRWRHEQSLLMTRQELKEESRRDDGDPLVRARLRKLQREASKKRMFEDVPRATVVITNPTHLAVALRYDRNTMTAPRVIAKGAGHVAKRITDLARTSRRAGHRTQARCPGVIQNGPSRSGHSHGVVSGDRRGIELRLPAAGCGLKISFELKRQNEPQRHREHRGRPHRESQNHWFTGGRFRNKEFRLLCVSSLGVLCASVVRSIFGLTADWRGLQWPLPPRRSIPIRRSANAANWRSRSPSSAYWWCCSYRCRRSCSTCC